MSLSLAEKLLGEVAQRRFGATLVQKECEFAIDEHLQGNAETARALLLDWTDDSLGRGDLAGVKKICMNCKSQTKEKGVCDLRKALGNNKTENGDVNYGSFSRG